MPKKNYNIELSEEEREQLQKTVSSGKSTAKEIRRSNILLATDDNRIPKLTTREVAQLFQVSPQTVQTVRKSYVEQGVKATVQRKKREISPVARKITGDIEAKIIELSCTEAPEGYCKWTVRLLTDKVVELGYIDSIGRTSVNEVLKKTN